MTDSDKTLIINMYNNKKRTTDIVRMLPYTESEANRCIQELRKQGVLRRENRVKESPQQIAVLQAYNDGITTVAEIAERIGGSPQSVRNALSVLKLRCTHAKRHSARLSDKTQQIIAAVKDGEASGDICRQFNVTRQYVSEVKKKYLRSE